ncbi:MAG: YidC/Oxa1 family insertase periplasmic-domain containing protein [Planctomycetota bacterium]
MNTGKAFTFAILSSTIMMAALLWQISATPQPQKQPAGQEVTQNGDANPPADEAAGQSSAAENQEKSETAESGSPSNAELEGSKSDSTESETQDPSQQTNESKEILNTDSDSTSPNQTSASQGDDLIAFGALDKEGKSRYLVTINKRGGTLRRVELNFRNIAEEDAPYEYRDMVWEGGYLGELECIELSSGKCTVQIVGQGTPAYLAGVEKGDVITSVDDEVIIDADDFQNVLANSTEPGQTIRLGIKRDGVPMELSVKLTDKPIELVRPEPGWGEEDDFDYPESFVFSVLVPNSQPDKGFPDLESGMRDQPWEVVPSDDPTEIVLQYTVSEQSLKELEVPGPVIIRRRYRLPELTPETIGKLDSRTFHLEMVIEIENQSDQTQKLAFELDGPSGIPTETWWYGYKIHGNQTAIGSIGGARDVVGSTAANSYIFYGCSEIVAGAKKDPPKIYWLCDWQSSDPESKELFWAGVDAHYFNVSLIPSVQGESGFATSSVSAFLNGRKGDIPEIPKNVRLQRLMDVTFQMAAAVEIKPKDTYSQSFDIFMGPKEAELLQNYGLGDVRTFGWFSWFSYILLGILHFFYWITGGFSYGLAIIMLTVLVRSFMIPFSRKAALNAQMMQMIQPELKEITEKHKDDLEKRTAAQRELYKKYNFNPLSGCLMAFIQLPIFYGLYKGLNVDIALRDQPLIPGMEWCSNLAAPDRLFEWQSWMPFGLGEEASWLGPYFNLLPILTMILFLMQQRLFTPPPTDDQQKLMQQMMTFMMIAMGVMFFKVPSGLCVYFITSSLWAVIERKLIPKPVLDTSKIKVDQLSSRESKKLDKRKAAADKKRESELEERRRINADRKKRLKRRDQ